MVTISILANTVRPSGNWEEIFSWQDPVDSWKAGPGEIMTVENLIILFVFYNIKNKTKTVYIYYILYRYIKEPCR